MGENGDVVAVDTYCVPEKSGLDALDGEVNDLDEDSLFEDAAEGEERSGYAEEQIPVENGREESPEKSPDECETEEFAEVIDSPSQEANGYVGMSDSVECSSESPVNETPRDTVTGKDEQGVAEIAPVVRDGNISCDVDSSEAIKQRAGGTDSNQHGFLVHGAEIGSAIDDEGFDVEVSGVSVVSRLRDVEGDFEGGDDQSVQVSAIETCVSDRDTDEKEREATSEPPVDVVTRIGKSSLSDSTESSLEDVAVSQNEHINGALEAENEEEVGFTSVRDEQLGEEEESITNEISGLRSYNDEVTSHNSSEAECVSIQGRLIEELCHKHVVQPTMSAETATTLIGSPVNAEISHSSLKENTHESIAHENTQSVTNGNSGCSATSGYGEEKTSLSKQLDETSQAEARENPSLASNISSNKTIGNSSVARSGDSSTPSRPAGLGSAASLLEPAPRSQQQGRASGTIPPIRPSTSEETANGEADEDNETREKLQTIRVKFLRLAHRLGQTPHNPVVAQVLYRLGLAEQLRGSRAGSFSFDRASALAEQLEAAGQDALDFSCTIMVVGKTGVGKSATINSIFDEMKLSTDAFQIGTKKVQAVVGTVQGIKVRVIDTPGLLSSFVDQRHNEKILRSVKSFIKNTPPDIVLYLDRLDMQTRDYGDLPLLRTISDVFGPAVWFNAIVVLTHAASAPPEGPNGTLSYEMFVAQRSHVVQQAIRQAAGDMRLMNPVSLVENHSACRTNRAGQRVLPNGQVWKPHLLLLSFASKILSEANALLKLQTNSPGKPFGMRSRAPPLPFLLSSLLQSRPQLKLPEEQFGDEDAMDDDLDESSDSDDEHEYDELPPFKRLSKNQISKLNKEQRKAYFDELDYREKLFMKKQLKEERKRRKLLKKMASTAKPNEYNENVEEESGGAASVPIPMPDMSLPASFDSDNPTHRYRYLDTSSQWLVRPVLDAHGWDHDVGYEGLNVERLFVVKDRIPISINGQLTKDKREANLQLECASSIKYGEGKATSLGFDMQTIGKDIAYTLRSETNFSNFRRNKASAGLSVTLLGDSLTAGLKFEDKLMLHKWLKVVMTGGAMASKGDVAYGGSLEATLRDKDYPIGRMLSTFGLSVMDWHGDLAIGCNLQSQIPVGRGTNLIARGNLNNRGAGQVSIRLNSSQHLQIALTALFPLLRNIIENRLFSSQPIQ